MAGLLMSATFSPAKASSSSWPPWPRPEAEACPKVAEAVPTTLLLNWAGGAGIAVIVSIAKSTIFGPVVCLSAFDRIVEADLPLRTVAVLDRLDEGRGMRSTSGLGTWM